MPQMDLELLPPGLESLTLWLDLASDMQQGYGLPLLSMLEDAPQLLLRSVVEVSGSFYVGSFCVR